MVPPFVSARCVVATVVRRGACAISSRAARARTEPERANEPRRQRETPRRQRAREETRGERGASARATRARARAGRGLDRSHNNEEPPHPTSRIDCRIVFSIESVASCRRSASCAAARPCGPLRWPIFSRIALASATATTFCAAATSAFRTVDERRPPSPPAPPPALPTFSIALSLLMPPIFACAREAAHSRSHSPAAVHCKQDVKSARGRHMSNKTAHTYTYIYICVSRLRGLPALSRAHGADLCGGRRAAAGRRGEARSTARGGARA